MKNFHQFLDDLANSVNAFASGAELQALAKNKQLSAEIRCLKCASSMYLSIDKIHHSHLEKNAQPPSITCPKCGCDSDMHTYQGIV